MISPEVGQFQINPSHRCLEESKKDEWYARLFYWWLFNPFPTREAIGKPFGIFFETGVIGSRWVLWAKPTIQHPSQYVEEGLCEVLLIMVMSTWVEIQSFSNNSIFREKGSFFNVFSDDNISFCKPRWFTRYWLIGIWCTFVPKRRFLKICSMVSKLDNLFPDITICYI